MAIVLERVKIIQTQVPIQFLNRAAACGTNVSLLTYKLLICEHLAVLKTEILGQFFITLG